MNQPLRLDPPNPGAALAIERALAASLEEAPSLTVRCGWSRCREVLALAGETTAGLLFTSWWDAPLPDASEVIIAGRKLGANAANKWAEHHRISEHPRPVGRDGVLAVLDLSHPPLLVRCIEHGDVILSPSDIRAALPSRELAADVTRPFHDYVISWQPRVNSTAERSRTTYRVDRSTT